MPFELVTTWHLAAKRQAVWDVLSDIETWPQWWPAFTSADVTEPGAPDGLGRAAQVTVDSGIGYTLTFTLRTVEVRAPELVVGRAEGHLQGSGRWTLTENGAGTAATTVVLVWQVAVTRTWMRLAVPVAAKVFRRSHDRVMRQGEQGLADRLRSGS